MKNLFKKGAIAAGLLAIGAALGFARTEKGQEVVEDLQQDLKDLAVRVKNDLGELQDVTAQNVDAVVAAVVDEYASKKEMAQDTKDKLVAALRAKWHAVEKEYLA